MWSFLLLPVCVCRHKFI
ncbi:hypothetical protein DX887_04795 [Vibrio alginolyticus]|nr:hypothetical protein [Vibrio alginolyticus]NNN52995.1 hypothetical protein [Vibrio sp. 2-2(7)]NNN86224.1 hypothetical protein [Vibrio sp. 2-2(9)]EGR0145290.1 hypothetical protein [Vibrio alginolyticus]EGR0170313.1 hypothetical protein [Vibrio alginolyticus]